MSCIDDVKNAGSQAMVSHDAPFWRKRSRRSRSSRGLWPGSSNGKSTSSFQFGPSLTKAASGRLTASRRLPNPTVTSRGRPRHR